MKVGILTAGGDCPGLNAAIRGVAKTAILKYGMEVIGISSGFLGLINKEYTVLQESDVSGILTLGGTILGTSREKPFKRSSDIPNSVDKPKLSIKHYKELGLDCLVCIGGNGTQKTALLLQEAGLNIISIPKTIDNDVWGTEASFGFDSALQIATDAIDRLHTTANSHKRIMVIELMGHHTGWLALHAGIAAGGDVILIPEIKYDEKIITDYLVERANKQKNYSIVVVAEGIFTPKMKSAGHYIAKLIEEKTNIETRETVLGYIQRGGSPSPKDRLLATRFGSSVADLIAKKKFGNMVALQNDEIVSVSLNSVAGKIKNIPKDYSLIKQAKSMGTCFGDEKVSINKPI